MRNTNSIDGGPTGSGSGTRWQGGGFARVNCVLSRLWLLCSSLYAISNTGHRSQDTPCGAGRGLLRAAAGPAQFGGNRRTPVRNNSRRELLRGKRLWQVAGRGAATTPGANLTRIADGGLLPGTYATTEADAKNVKTGLEAVARYALPNPKPAVYVFTVKPLKDTPIQRGIVEPEFGQPGKGVEVLFCDGTAARTVTDRGTIPER